MIKHIRQIMNTLRCDKLILIIVIFYVVINLSSCSETDIKDNVEIIKMYQKDISIRELDAKTDTVNLEAYDKVHRERVFELLAENKVQTPLDKMRAALILQHTAAKICDGEVASMSPENFLLAYKLSSASLKQLLEKNDTATVRKENIRRMVALNYDRYLLYTLGYQKFGTQFVFDNQTNEMLLAPIDTSLCSDGQRIQHQVEPLHILLKKYKMKPLAK
ncbi:MAG: hypothetical protein KIT51_06535 [Cyclobacteriaceae bacterium]|nr:MAG: hypothetical protein KIT51_06535 [Cyclobacteriaceae bacterium]